LGKKQEKYIPRDLLFEPIPQLKILFEALMSGDGHNLYNKDLIDRETVNTPGGSSYATTSIRLRNDFQELLLKIGLSGSIRLQSEKGTPWEIEGRNGISNFGLWVIGISYLNNEPHKKGNYWRNSKGEWEYKDVWEESWIPYHGVVYCATVPNHTMFVRRNGCVMWSGNSGGRAQGRISDIVYTLNEAWDYVRKGKNHKQLLAEEWAKKNDWRIVTQQWVTLFEKCMSSEERTVDKILGETV
jgi:hypothetical protein